MAQKETKPEQWDLLSRVLSIFAPVRPGEGGTALLLSLNVFLLLTAYYTIKIVRESLILSMIGGAVLKSYASGGMVFLLIPIIAAYSKLVERYDRVKLVTIVTFFFVSNLVIFYGLNLFNVPLGIPFFLWVGIFSRVILAQFWSFANDVYSREEGERLFPIVAIGSATGAVAGAYAVKALEAVIGKSIEVWMLIASGLLVVCVGLTRLIDRRERGRQHRTVTVADSPPPEPEPPMSKDGAFTLIFSQRYLLLMALMIMLLNWVNSSGEFILGSLAKVAAVQAAGGDKAAERAFIGQFYADFFLYVNLVGMALQFFVVSRVIKWFGVRVALAMLPAVALGGYITAAIAPVLAVVRWTKTAENSLDYSMQNTASQSLFLVTSREVKYKAKQAIDTVFVRVGDVMSAMLVGVLIKWLALDFSVFIYLNIGLVALWLAVVVFVGRDYARLAAEKA